MDMISIGEALRAARKSQGLTQTDLARPLGMSRATISALETGRIGELGVRKLEALLAGAGLVLTVIPRPRPPTLDELRAERRSEIARR